MLGTFFTLPAQSHLKWFVDTGLPEQSYSGNLYIYASAWLLISLAVILVGTFLNKRYPRISLTWAPRHIEPYATAIIGIFIGISLLISASQGILFSANINSIGPLHLTLLLLEGFTGLSLIIGLAVKQASLLLLGLWLSAFYFVDAIDVLENIWIIGVVLFFFLRERSVLRSTQEDIFCDIQLSQSQAINFLRIFLGLNLILLGFSEKIFHPALGLAFLQEYPWNFMANLGVTWFTDELFVFSAGVVEAILGLFLVIGWVTRLTAIVLACLFLTPPFFMGAKEIIGHIPHIAIVVSMLIFGRGTSMRGVFYVLKEKWHNPEYRPAPALLTVPNQTLQTAPLSGNERRQNTRRSCDV